MLQINPFNSNLNNFTRDHLSNFFKIRTFVSFIKYLFEVQLKVMILLTKKKKQRKKMMIFWNFHESESVGLFVVTLDPTSVLSRRWPVAIKVQNICLESKVYMSRFIEHSHSVKDQRPTI